MPKLDTLRARLSAEKDPAVRAILRRALALAEAVETSRASRR